MMLNMFKVSNKDIMFWCVCCVGVWSSVSGAGWFWAISDYFVIYAIYVIYFFQLYSYHLKAFSSR